jgi:hypothetical protein
MVKKNPDKFVSKNGARVARVSPHPFVNGYAVTYTFGNTSFLSKSFETKAEARAHAKSLVTD